MEEDGIPPNSFCSAPPHREPEPPVLPLLFVTPRCCDDDGQPGRRRSGRIQGFREQTPKKLSQKDRSTTQRPSRQCLPPARGERTTSMVQSLSVKHLEADTTVVQEQRQNEHDAPVLDTDAEQPARHKDQKGAKWIANQSPTQNVDKRYIGNTVPELETNQFNMGKDEGLVASRAVGSSPSEKGWVIGPLFQSLKSKMASFTEIVMSPVRLFKPSSPPPSLDEPDEVKHSTLPAFGGSHQEHTEAGETPDVLMEDVDEDSGAAALSEDGRTSCINFNSAHSERLTGHSAKLKLTETVTRRRNLRSPACEQLSTAKCMMDIDLAPDSCPHDDRSRLSEAETIADDYVPLQPTNSYHNSFTNPSSLFPYPSDHVGASSQTQLNVLGDIKKKNAKTDTWLKPMCRKRIGCRSQILPSENPATALDLDGSCSLPINISEAVLNGKESARKCDPNLGVTKVSDAFIEKTQPPSISHHPPDTLVEADACIERDFSPKSPRNASQDYIVTTLDNKPVEKPQQHWERKRDDTLVNSAVRAGRVKRSLKLVPQADTVADCAKRTRLRAAKEGTKLNVLNSVSNEVTFTGFKLSGNEVGSEINMKIAVKSAETGVPVLECVKGRGKRGQKKLVINEAGVRSETEKSSVVMTASGSSLDPSCSLSGKDSDGRNSRASCWKSNRDEPDNVDGVSLTTSEIATLEKEQQLPVVMVQPRVGGVCGIRRASKAQTESISKERCTPAECDVEIFGGPSKFKKLKTKPLKRKLRNQEISAPDHGSASENAPALFGEMLETAPSGMAASLPVHKEVRQKMGKSQQFKRPKGNGRSSVNVPGLNEVAVESCRGDHVADNGDILSAESLSAQPEQEPIAANQKAVLSPDQLYPECFVSLNICTEEQAVCTPKISKKSTTVLRVDELMGTTFERTGNSLQTTDREQVMEEQRADLTDNDVSEFLTTTRRIRKRPRRTDSWRKKRRMSKHHKDGAEETSLMFEETTDPAEGQNDSLSRCLMRSYSCPEIPSLTHRDTPSPSVASLHPPQYFRPPDPHPSPSHAPHTHKSSRRTRRHTVGSIEIEREIAPLCLRKEVYPARRTASYGGSAHCLSPGVPLSPSISLSALACRFLSSPLAFLSKKLENRGASDSSIASGQVSPSSSTSLGFFPSKSPSASPGWHSFAGFLPRTDTPATVVSSPCSSVHIPVEGESEAKRQSEEDEFGENTSCSSHEFEDLGMRDDKALSDSEIKVVSKDEERRKVSSIRIRKALPKPQNNLTPMGLPRPIRLKKKEFSLEEIYTNKNFAKPAEGRLETIFELPLSRRNGSQSHFGQKRVKRFTEFPEVGVVRKPKKPLAGAGKAGSSLPVARPRRGNYQDSKEPSINLQDLDSLLCSKLDQLDIWLTCDQEGS